MTFNSRIILCLLFIILGIYIAQAISMNFTQDDSYISYRYAKNLVNGDGLVFNKGERVEGYTNFLWIILLALFTSFGLDIITVSKVLGVASGAVAVFLTYLISCSFFKKYKYIYRLIPPFILALNGAFAYWSISGMETSFFVMLVLLSLYLYINKNPVFIVASALSALTRPEGVMVFGLIIIHELLIRKDTIKTTLVNIAGFAALLIPFAVFKLVYYGDLLPNPFYAKTGMSVEYFKTGFEYLFRFLKHYGFLGLIYLLPIVFFNELKQEGKLLVLVSFIYTIYIVFVGGDVLNGHRFFLAFVPLLYILFTYVAMQIISRINEKVIRVIVSICLVVVISSVTFFVPRHWLFSIRNKEIGLIDSMAFHANILKETFGSDVTLAISTIGAISYYSGATVIDMLGLTDRNIAKNPEAIPGITPTWKEKNYNVHYLLSRDPDLILFSTGIRPSAPAEKALFLSSKFRENYYIYSFPINKKWYAFYKRKGEYDKENKIFGDTRFIDHFAQATKCESVGDYKCCINSLQQAIEVGPENFSWGYDYLAKCYYITGDIPTFKKYANKAIEMDDYCIASHLFLYITAMREKNEALYQRERQKVVEYNPEILTVK
ncbi:hypothetical protein JXI42_04550 [bacterium]|nr:hypothetical protein [bacterium]